MGHQKTTSTLQPYAVGGRVACPLWVISGQAALVQTSAYFCLNKVSPTNPNAINLATPSYPEA